MEQLMVTPLRPAELIPGKTIPFAVLGFVGMIIVTVVGVFWFGVSIQGSNPLLFFSALRFTMRPGQGISEKFL